MMEMQETDTSLKAPKSVTRSCNSKDKHKQYSGELTQTIQISNDWATPRTPQGNGGELRCFSCEMSGDKL